MAERKTNRTNNRYNIPSRQEYLENKAAEARINAARHIQQQEVPNVPILPRQIDDNYFHPAGYASYLAAKIMNMSDEERIKLFGTANVRTCIYTATNQFNDKGALVPGNKTFREEPERYGFHEVPMDSARVGDLIQLTCNFDGHPYHSTIMVGRDNEGMPHVSYSRGYTTQFFDDGTGTMQPTMVKDTVLTAFNTNPEDRFGSTPAAFRYEGSPQKRLEWLKEYSQKYNQRIFPTPEPITTKHTEVPDAIRVDKPSITKAEGGQMTRKKWDDLSMAEKAEMMKVAVRQGIVNLSDIKQKYNEFAEGGDTTVGGMVNAIYQNNPREEFLGEPEHHYDFTQSNEWADAHGYYPDARGHRDDRVKKVAHPSHPSRGTWDGNKFILSDFGMETPNYTLFGLNDGGQDPQATLIYDNGVVLPEVTVTPNKNYFFNPYDNIELHYAKGGKIHIKPENRGKFTALKERTGHSATWFKEHGTPAQKKMATFALNARHWKHGLGGPLVESIADENIYGLGDWIEKARGFIKKIGLDRSPEQHLIEYFTEGDESEKSGRQKVYKAIDGSVHSTKEAAIQRNNNLAKEGRAYMQRGSNIKGIRSKVVPRKPNTSSTAEKSMQLENDMFSRIDGYRERTNYRTKPYDIPYGTKEIKVQPKGSTLPFNISVNALDSVAKYAGATGTPIEVALGLPMQETAFGRNPLFNYKKLGENYSSQDLGNANYFKNFESIPAEYLVRDFRYNGDIVFNGKRDEPISLDTPPLQHAFEYFNAGKYNTNDKNHTKDVKAAGNALWDETTGSLLNWWNTEGKSWYSKGTKQKKKK